MLGDRGYDAKTGQQLFYRHARPDKADEVVSVTVNPDGSIGPPLVVPTGDSASGRASFDFFPDGSLLLMKELPAAPPTLEAVANWIEELKARVTTR